MTTCITCNVIILPFPLSFHASNFISILDYLSYLYSNYNGGIETKSKTKDAPSLCEFLCCSKNKVWRFANRVVVEGDAWYPQAYGVDHSWIVHAWRRGMLGHPQAYGFHQSLDDSHFGVPSFPVKTLHHKTLSHFFSVGVTLVIIKIKCKLS